MTERYRCNTSVLHDAEWEILRRDSTKLVMRLVNLGTSWAAKDHRVGETTVVTVGRFAKEWEVAK